MRVPPAFLDEIRARLPVSQIVGRTVQLKRQGREFIGLSPFKQEKTPSFTVNDEKGFYHCFATGAHGDIFSFLIETEGLSFFEAVERLAGEAGLSLPQPTPEVRQQTDVMQRMRDAHEEACHFFEKSLLETDFNPARKYLDGRGLTQNEIEKFRLGFAPDSKTALKDHLVEKGFEKSLLVKAGLLIQPEQMDAQPYDRFRGRLIFPICDLKGRPVAFGGRALADYQKAKYINSPETPLYHKGDLLYNAHRARKASYEAGSIIAVEGYMDVIACDSAGAGHCVAPLGTALTSNQLAGLWRMAKEPVMCFDGDSAGTGAALRAIETALPMLQPGFSLKFAFLPTGQDPDDILRNDGADVLLSMLDRAQSMVDVLWTWQLNAAKTSTPEQKAALDQRINQIIDKIENRSVQYHYRQEFRNRLRAQWSVGFKKKSAGNWQGNSAQFVTSQGRRGQRERSFQGRGVGGGMKIPAVSSMMSPNISQSHRMQQGSAQNYPREANILILVLHYPELLEEFSEELALLKITSNGLMLLRESLLELLSGDSLPENLDISFLRAHLLSKADTTGVLEQLDAWFEASGQSLYKGKSFKYVRSVFDELIKRHQRSTDLMEEKKRCHQALLEDYNEANLQRLEALQAQIEADEQSMRDLDFEDETEVGNDAQK